MEKCSIINISDEVKGDNIMKKKVKSAEIAKHIKSNVFYSMATGNFANKVIENKKFKKPKHKPDYKNDL